MSTESNEKLDEVLKRIQSMDKRINWFDVPHILIKGCINTILCEDPHIRTIFTRNIVFQILENSKLAIYIDLDTMFTVSLECEKPQIHQLDNLIISNPDCDNIDRVIAEVSSLNTSNLGLIVFDSVTTFYHIFPNDINYGDLNRKLSVYLFLLKKLAIKLNASILIVSLLRAKKVSLKSPWIYGYAGGRVLERMSDVIITLAKINNHLEIKLLKHVIKNLEGKVFILPL